MRQANKGKLLLLLSSVSLTQLLGEEGGEWRHRNVRLSLGIGDSHKRVAVTGNSSTYVEDVELAVDPYHLEWNLITLLSRCTSCRCITRFILRAIESRFGRGICGGKKCEAFVPPSLPYNTYQSCSCLLML